MKHLAALVGLFLGMSAGARRVDDRNRERALRCSVGPRVYAAGTRPTTVSFHAYGKSGNAEPPGAF